MPRVRLLHIALVGCALLGACADTSNLAPPTPHSPAQFQSSDDVTTTASPAVAPSRFATPPNLAVELPSPGDIDSNHTYSLVELIDIAQRRNPATRVAWEEARQAAINVGVAQAAYLPALTASAVGGYERVILPFPPQFQPGSLVSAVPQLTVSYLLLDFGGRAASVEQAGQLSSAANAQFTAVHQKLIFDVARAYFILDGAEAAVRAARQAVTDSQVLQQSAEALYGRGLGTVVNVDLARRGTAQAQYDLSQAVAAQRDAMYALLAAMDLPPTTKLRVAHIFARPLPPRTTRTVDDLLRQALRQRPDMFADVAKLRATDAAITLARSELAPKVLLNARAGGEFARLNLTNLPPPFSIGEKQGAALLTLSWPLYDGGLLENKLRLAESQHAMAADVLKGRTDQALREVALAYDQIETGLQQYNAAVALQKASETAFSSASASYAQGVSTFTDAVSAQTGLASARAAVVRAHAQSLINAAALAFATGLLTSSSNFTAVVPR
jgi:outer membrane protein